MAKRDQVYCISVTISGSTETYRYASIEAALRHVQEVARAALRGHAPDEWAITFNRADYKAQG